MEPAGSSGTTTNQLERGAARAWAFSIAQAVLGAYFFAAGVLAIRGTPLMVSAFERLGLSAPWRVLIGLVELVGAVGLVLDRTARAAAAALATLMIASMYVHVARVHIFPELLEGLVVVPPLLMIAYGFRPQNEADENRRRRGGHGRRHKLEHLSIPVRTQRPPPPPR
jgi:uncharacterized membrane protein YphA (DoxX/SURF4 family)